MDEQKKGGGAIMWAVVVVVIALIAYGAYAYSKKSQLPVDSTGSTTDTSVPSSVTSVYKDGSYSAIGSYISPGGQETIAVRLTLKDDVITDITVTPQATRPESVNFQGQFAAGYKPFVIGKKISDVAVTKVSGSSLSPKGFMDALSQIKAQARV